jgi:AcrR family transcriptional regulator
MQHIVAAAGTSIGNCYFLFPNKEAVLAALVEEANQTIGAAVDRAIARASSGPARAAIAIHAGVIALSQQASLARIFLIEAAHGGLRARTVAFFAARVRRFFAAHPELLGDDSLDMIALAWSGANLQIIEGLIAGELQHDPDATGKFLARWNLRAIGLPENVVAEALAAIDQLNERMEEST